MSAWPAEDRSKPTTRDAFSEVLTWAEDIRRWADNSKALSEKYDREGNTPMAVEALLSADVWQFRYDALRLAAGILMAAEGHEDELRTIARKKREKAAKAAKAVRS